LNRQTGLGVYDGLHWHYLSGMGIWAKAIRLGLVQKPAEWSKTFTLGVKMAERTLWLMVQLRG